MALLLSTSRASAMPVEVHASGCVDVDEREVARLLGLELAFVPSVPVLREALRVDLVCSAERLRIDAVDPITRRPLEREIALGPPDPGRERTIALLASQLLITSWAESFVEHPETPPAAPPTRTEAPGPSREESDRPHDPTSHDWEILGGVGLRLRDWSSPAVGERVVIQPSLGVGRVRVMLALAYERGTTQRTAGSVAWSMMSAGAGVGWRSRRSGALAVEAFALGSIVAVDARGDPVRPGFVGGSAQGVLGEVSAAVGPVVFLGPLRAALESQLGVTLPKATARDASDREVALGGLWAGVTLVVGAGGSGW